MFGLHFGNRHKLIIYTPRARRHNPQLAKDLSRRSGNTPKITNILYTDRQADSHILTKF